MEATTNSNGKETIRPSKGTSLSFKVCWPGSTNVSASQIAYNLFIPVMALPSFLLLPRQKCQLQVISFLMQMIFEHPPQASPQPRSPACNLSCWISIPVSLSLPLPKLPQAGVLNFSGDSASCLQFPDQRELSNFLQATYRV